MERIISPAYKEKNKIELEKNVSLCKLTGSNPMKNVHPGGQPDAEGSK
jgi:hypothetical protein